MDASTWVSGLARRVRHAASEVHHANRIASTLMLSYGLAESDRAPDTYEEFLLRVKAAYRHEPSARHRATGHQVRLGRADRGAGAVTQSVRDHNRAVCGGTAMSGARP